MLFLFFLIFPLIFTFDYKPGVWIGKLGKYVDPPYTTTQNKLSFWDGKTGEVYVFKNLLGIEKNTTVEHFSFSVDTFKIGVVSKDIKLKKGIENHQDNDDYYNVYLSIYDYSNLKTKMPPIQLGYCVQNFTKGEYVVCSQYVYGIFYVITDQGNIYSTTGVQGKRGDNCNLVKIDTLDSSSLPSISFPCDYFVKGQSFHFLSADKKNYCTLVMRDNQLYTKSFQKVDIDSMIASSVIDQENGNFFFKDYMSSSAFKLTPTIFTSWENTDLPELSKISSIIGSDGRYYDQFNDDLIINFSLDDASTFLVTAKDCKTIWEGPQIQIPDDFNVVSMYFRYDAYHSISN